MLPWFTFTTSRRREMDLSCASIPCKYTKERLPVKNGLRKYFCFINSFKKWNFPARSRTDNVVSHPRSVKAILN